MSNLDAIRAHYEGKPTPELLSIWLGNDKDAYSEDAFEAIQLILHERQIEIPPQSEFIPKLSEPDWDVKSVKKKRILYLIFFVLTVVGNVMTFFIREKAVLFYLPCFIVFLCLFILTIKQVNKYSIGALIGIILVLLIPFVSIIILAIEDRGVYNAIRRREHPELMEQSKRRVSLLAVFSLVLLLLPVIGLPMAIVGSYKISKSQGKLYGKTLAWISIVLNSLLLLLVIAGIVITLVFGPPANYSTVQTSPFGEIPITGCDLWKIDGKDYKIDGTSVVILPKEDNNVGSVIINGKVATTSKENELLYVIKVIVDFDVKGGGHKELAKKIATFAYSRGLYDKANKIERGNQPIALSNEIGVALVQQVSSMEGLISSNSGYRYKIPLSEIREE